MNHQDWKPVIFNKKKTQTKRGPGRSHASKIEQSEETKVKKYLLRISELSLIKKV